MSTHRLEEAAVLQHLGRLLIGYAHEIATNDAHGGASAAYAIVHTLPHLPKRMRESFVEHLDDSPPIIAVPDDDYPFGDGIYLPYRQEYVPHDDPNWS